MNTIVRGFKKVLDFKGRDRRSSFWPYAGVIIAGGVVATVVAMVPAAVRMFNQTLAFAEANPDKATITRTPTSVHVRIHDPTGMPPMDVVSMVWPMSLVLVVMALLLAAAITRRLHDRGLSGFWALIPLAFYGFGLASWARLMSSAFTQTADAAQFIVDFMLTMLVVLLGQLSMIVMVIMLALKGKTGPNRYGSKPV